MAALVIAGGGLFGYTAWSSEQARAQRLAEQVGKAEAAAQGLPFDRITEAEFRRILPYLDAARDLPRAARVSTDFSPDKVKGVPWDLALQPIFDAHCVDCHDGTMNGANKTYTVQDMTDMMTFTWTFDLSGKPATVLLMLTSSDAPQDRQRAAELPVIQGYVTKPLTADMVRRMLARDA